MSYPPSGFFFFYKIPQMIFLIFPVIIRLKSMQQIVVKIACTCTFQACLKLSLCHLLRWHHRSKELGRKGIGFSGIPVHERKLRSRLRSRIYESRIKISHSGFHKKIHHAARLFDVYAKPFSRQPHQPKSELSCPVNIYLSHSPLLSPDLKKPCAYKSARFLMPLLIRYPISLLSCLLSPYRIHGSSQYR